MMAYQAHDPPSSPPSRLSPYSTAVESPPNGLALPRMHLGTFSSMEPGTLFDTVGRGGGGGFGGPAAGSVPSDSPDRRNGASRANSGDSYGGPERNPPLFRDVSQSSEGRARLPRSSMAVPPGPDHPPFASPAGQPLRHGSSLSSPPSSRMPSSGMGTTVATDTPPTIDEATSPLIGAIGTADVAPTPKSHSPSYLPPGAASPHIRAPSHYTPDSANMTGVGSGGGRSASGGYPSVRSLERSSTSPSATSEAQASLSKRGTYTQNDRPPSRPKEDEPSRDTGTDPQAAGPSNRHSPSERRRSGDQQPPMSPGPSVNNRRLDIEPPSNGFQEAAPSSSRRINSQHIPQQASPPPPNLQQTSPYQQSAPPQQPKYPRVAAEQPMPQTRGGPKAAPVVVEEVCVECMMRDRDMADVEVVGEGIWERDSDVDYRELLRKEEEAEYRARMSGLPMDYPLSKPRARGGPLSEENLKVWLTMNPKEPQARWQTLEAYLRSQHTLLVAEAAARAQAMRESRLMDNRMRETYSHVRESTHETGAKIPPGSSAGLPVPGVPVRVPRSSSVYSSIHVGSPEKEATLLENGLIVERVDLKKEEHEERARQKREDRQRRRMSSVGVNDAASAYSAPSPTFDNSSATYVQGASPYALPNYSVGQLSPASSKRFSVLSGGMGSSIRPNMTRATSHMSNETAGTGVRRFFGYMSRNGQSQSSLALSGSMMDMHLGLDQDRRGHIGQDIPYDLSAPPSMEYGNRDTYIDRGFVTEPEVMNDKASSNKTKKKAKGLGKLWKLMTGHGKDAGPPKDQTPKFAAVEEDLSQPLAPPPPISYLVNGRADHVPHTKHRSSPSLSNGLGSPFHRDGANEDPRNSYGRDELDQDHGDDRDESLRARMRSPSVSDLRSHQRPLSSSPTPIPHPTLNNKTLPPLPTDTPGPVMQQTRPTTFYANREDAYSQGDLLAPRAPFRTEARRQSFNGMTNTANRQSWLPANGDGAPPQTAIASRYGEFGASRRSLGPMDTLRQATEDDATLSSRSTKTRSRFALSGLFGTTKKSTQTPPPMLHVGGGSSATLAPTRPYDMHHARDYSISHSSFSDVGNPRSNGSHNARQSVLSTKKLALIPQEDDFIAYRYPSHSQTLPSYR